MNPTSPGVSKVYSKGKPRDLSLLKDPKILSATVLASELNIKKESLYVEPLYGNTLSPLDYGSALSISGDLSSTLEVGLHLSAMALDKKHWVSVVDSGGQACSLALYEACINSPRFVCVRNFSSSRFVSVLSHLVTSMRVIVAVVPAKVSSAQMAKVMAKVRENNSILVFLDPNGLCEASFDRRIVSKTLNFEGLNSGSGVLADRVMEIEEFKHGIKISRDSSLSQSRGPLIVNG